jgi:hypothetical protein
MKYLVFTFAFFAFTIFSVDSLAQTKRPTKQPTQFDKIIDIENKDQPAQPATGTEKPIDATNVPRPRTDPMTSSDALVRALESLTNEVKSLVNEVRAGNARQQMQTDILQLNRVDLRIDRYESEQKTLRDRIAVIDAEKQNLDLLMSPQGIEAQVSRMPYADKNKAVQQVKESLDARFRAVSVELDRLRVRDNELSAILKSFRDYGAETEKHLQGLEEAVKKLVPNEEPKRQ